MCKDAQEPIIDQPTDYQLLSRQLEKFIIESDRPLSWLDIVPIAGEIVKKYPGSTLALLEELLVDKTFIYNKETQLIEFKPMTPSADPV